MTKGSCTGCHGGNPRSGRKNIAHQGVIAGRYAHFTLGPGPRVREGERLIELYACRRCHGVAGRGNRLAVSLDLVPSRRSAGEIAAAIRLPAKGMPAFGLHEDGIASIVNALYHGARQKRETAGVPLRVHFTAPAKRGEDLFSRRCGPCHRALTEQLGAVGTGDAGPNLSGLFSGHYLRTDNGDKGWTEKRLLLWVNNPRAVKPLARMRPVAFSPREIAELKRILQTQAQ